MPQQELLYWLRTARLIATYFSAFVVTMLYIAFWLAIGYLGGRIAAKKGYFPGLGVVIAVLLGPISLVLGLLLPKTASGRAQAEFETELNEESRIYDRRKHCPRCDRELSLMTKICPNCEHRFT